MPEIISRKDARARGLKRYFTGASCKHGHVDERYVTTRECCRCALLHTKKYAERHPDKIRAWALAGYHRAHAKDPEKFRERGRRARSLLIERFGIEDVRAKEREKNKEYRAKFPEKYAEYNKKSLPKKHQYYLQNREKWRKYQTKNKANQKLSRQKIQDLIAVLRKEMPDLLKEFGL